MLRYPILLLTLILSLPSQSFAWGKKGHNIVAEIAFHYLNDADKAKVLSYLDGMTTEDASIWMDQVRSQPEYKYTAPWHYVDFPKGTTYKPTDEPNAVNALTTAITALQHSNNLPTDSVRFYLLVIMHLTGDIHQPLHTGYAEDKGGNDYQVAFLGKGSNLHKVWDSEIIENQNITLEGCLAIADNFSQTEKQQYLRVNVLDWMNSSRVYLEGAYTAAHKIDESYVKEKAPIIKKQLAIAGLRLASILQQIAANLQPAKASTSTAKGREVTLDNLNDHIGEIVSVCGKVYSTKYLTTAKNAPTFINVGAAYPNSPLTVVIWEDVRNTLSYKPEEALDGKTICVIGKLELYKGKPEIVVQKEADISIK